MFFFSNYTCNIIDFVLFQLKRYRLDLKKAVNIPINAISASSGKHLRDKLETLVKLLTGKPVAIGNKQIQATQHPCALAMCKDMFAAKIVVSRS